ncbi:lipase maturation factor [Brevibacterium sanguinis]|uniref:Lipase maturation factor n=2 Tax=Brevibacterium TaxID=1696 RepID=A0A366IIP7_9MICO|nr:MULTISPECIES: lipase maturation factor family protein [Brevibacterium]RBP64666.1 lipase maturation factor [Brevibacterium sanguinis]RBP71691.1 lipase maturation factor [Brevibacterium celere]
MDWDWLVLLDAHDYTIAREVILRGVAAVFLLAFLSTFCQFPALLGDRGLLPARVFIGRTSARWSPSLFRWRRTPYSDRLLRIVCGLGMALAASVVVGLPQAGPAWAPIPVFLAMWGLYLSIVSIGQRFYGFGWESMLLEAGFVVGFLGSHEVAPPLLILLFLRWLMFRLEFGAGMIKMRGDSSWRDLTAMNHHHQTQPMPNPISRWAHLKPQWWHKAETLGSHIIQLGMPWLLFLPQPIASFAAGLIIVSQLALVITGNYAWLNWLTIILAFCGISDSFLRWLGGGPFPGWGWEGLLGDGTATGAPSGPSPLWWLILTTGVFLVLVSLSRRPLLNLFSSHQLMNASFNRWHLVNAYGAFGSMSEQRREVIIEGTLSERPQEEDWHAFEFKGKPGDVSRMPRQFAPYHLRLDWMMWFLALGDWGEEWFVRLLRKLLSGDPAVRRLLRIDPFDGRAPTMIRVRVFDYRFSTKEEKRETGQWWVREEIGILVPPRRHL